MGMVVSRFDVYLVQLEPTQGDEIQKIRPCLVISPDEMNRHIGTVIIAPMTAPGRDYPSRISCPFAGKQGRIILDPLHTIDKSRLVKPLSQIDAVTSQRIIETLQSLFAW
ncbi:MAG: type II toxin-antitoxin system PemK/MazF family toxin [Candidatus Sericytochromatia bacterium]|nr:type II toxin-antitoxin system PemK/MazF family toxin [Candidatus Sericytochromatia bacterium]